MPNTDAIELALNSPLDWGLFEKLVHDILVSDDFPRLRKIGGRGDKGIDAIEEGFYKDERRVDTVVQVTSERAEEDKFNRTLSTLEKNDVDFRQLVIVYRYPVASSIRTQIQKSGMNAGLAVDLRDQTYLIAQLGKPGSSIFARYFSDLATQVSKLLGADDPLQLLKGKSRHAMLATLGAYVINPHARVARQTIFQKTVLATLTASSSPSQISELVVKLKELLPEEVIDESRVSTAIRDLEKDGMCQIAGDQISPTNETLLVVGRVTALARASYDDLLNMVFAGCSRKQKLDDATKGFIERNVRRALLNLFRAIGPIDTSVSTASSSIEYGDDICNVLSKDLPPDIAKATITALSGYVENSENWNRLVPFVRSYSALAIRNVDPIGRRWQKAIFERSIVVLDTDVVLKLLNNHVPEHKAMRLAVAGLADAGIAVVVTDKIIEEVANHLSRADRTYNKFASSLFRMPAAMVDAQVWNVLARGYYYAYQAGSKKSWEEYWQGYYDRDNPQEFVRYLLKQRVNYQIRNLDDIPLEWQPDLEELTTYSFENLEHTRQKAIYRDENDMLRRVKEDLRMALHLAAYEEKQGQNTAKGYLASDDSAFHRIQLQPAWGQRPKVHIFARAIPELAEFICGKLIPDDEMVRLLFDPIVTAAAHLMEKEIQILASAGINLSGVSMERLEWDLSRQLGAQIHRYMEHSGGTETKRLESTIQLGGGALDLGYALDPRVEEVIKRYNDAIQEVETERQRREKAEETLTRLAKAAGATKKARRRVNQVLREFGITLKELSREPDDLAPRKEED